MNNLLYRIFFSAITRIVLGIALLLTDPLSVTFRCLIVIIFLLPVMRYMLHQWQQTEMDVFYTGYTRPGMIGHLFIVTGVAVLYVLVLAHVFSIYTTSYFWWILIIIVPVIFWYLLFGKADTFTERQAHNRSALLRTITFYIIPFFFAANYAFDISTPVYTKYYITRSDHKTHIIYDSETSEVDVYHFYMLPAGVMTATSHWQDVSPDDYYGIKSYDHYNGKDSLHYLVMDKRKGSDRTSAYSRERFQLLLLRTDTVPTRQTVPYRLYKRFKEGDYLSKVEHRGLFGIKWISYHEARMQD